MSDETWGMQCPYCGFEGASTGHYGSYIGVNFCPLCSWNDPEPRGDIFGEMYSYVREENPDLDEDSDEFQDKLQKAGWDWIEEEAGKPHTPTKAEIAEAKKKINYFVILAESEDYMDMVQEYYLFGYLDDEENFYKSLVLAAFGESM